MDALAAGGRRGGRFSAVIAGDGPERAALEAQARQAGIGGLVHFPGYVSRPEDVLEEADLMVLPSHTEGLPNAALEALAMEVPVLATRVGGTPEVVIDGKTGRLVPPRSPDVLAAAIEAFLVDPTPWRQMADCGRRLVEEEFSFRVRTRRVEALYGELIAETGR
jgi:glycosyltransferase involved in cell wall biosynthesis